MSDHSLDLMHVEHLNADSLVPQDPGASPFRRMVDPLMRYRLKKALFELIDNHDASLERYVAEGDLSLESYKEYIELFARCLRETMETKEGIGYLMKSCGFDIDPEEVNLYPEWRWNAKED